MLQIFIEIILITKEYLLYADFILFYFYRINKFI